MPYVRRNAAGHLVALFEQPEADAQEFVPHAAPEILQFLGLPGGRESFDALDVDFVRVLEDLIDVLTQKNILKLTDLPEQAQAKLLARRRLRADLHSPTLLLGNDDVI
ncbi:hypothetical protein [Chitiniphilus eburneus]|uniref:Tryptophan synthase subunit beta like protein n=1 Tax=Chitiniphilus eburneus TaxID=2571148 RepID=A0A4U0Q2M3_9NEIS|nr:hypothetical protein [Chitiniphilus eburneus]TJZ74292.1 hypothetical protein FAZ21_08385 [Chitiniphilus eburneus]